MKQKVEKLYNKLGKRFLAFALTAAMLCSSLALADLAEAAEGDASNSVISTLSIPNADMEERALTSSLSWKCTDWVGAWANSDVVYKGSRSGRVDAGDQMISENGVAVTAGAIYEIGLWAKTSGKTAGGYTDLQIVQFDSSSNQLKSERIAMVYGEILDWYELKGSVQLLKNTASIKIKVVNGESGDLYLDDVYGNQISASTSGTGVNADFEELTSATDAAGASMSYPTGWRIAGLGNLAEGSVKTPAFYASTAYYHSKVNSKDANYGHSLYFAKDSKDNVTIENTNTFVFDAATYSEFAAGAYIRSVNSDGFARVDLVVSDDEGNSKVITGYTKMLNAGKELSDWKCFYSEINIAKLELDFTPTKAYYQLVFTGDKVECYIDDLFCVGTNEGYGKIVDWSDFHAVSGGSAADAGEEKIVGWDVESGAASVADSKLTLTDGSIKHTDTHLMENKAYEVSVTNSIEAEEGAGTATNLVSNGDFDADGSMDTTGWSLGDAAVYGTNLWPSPDFSSGANNIGTKTTCTYATSTDSYIFNEVTNGDYGSMALVSDADDRTNTYLQVTNTAATSYTIGKGSLAAVVDTAYTIRFKLKNFGDNTAAVIEPLIIDRGSNTTTNKLASITASEAAGWTEFVYTFTASSACTSWDLRFNLCGAASVWGIDDIYIYATQETGTTPITYKQNAVRGGTFDTSLKDGVYDNHNEFEFKASSNCTVAWVADAGTSGGAMTITPSTTEAYTSVYIPVVAGKTYKYEFDALGVAAAYDSTTSRLNAYIIERPTVAGSATATKNNAGLNHTAPVSTWNHYYGTYTVQSTGFVEFRMKFTNNATAMVTIDNFAFTFVETLYTDGVILHDSDADGTNDYEMRLTNNASATYSSISLTEGKTYDYSYGVAADSTLTTAALKVGDTVLSEKTGSFTYAGGVVAFVTEGTGEAYFDDLVISEAADTSAANWTTAIAFYDINGDEIDASTVVGYSGDAVLSQTLSGAGTAKLSFLAPVGVYKAVVTISGSGVFSDFVIFEGATNSEDSDWQSSFVWYPEDATAEANQYQFRFFRHRFDVDTKTHGAVKAAYLQLYGDDSIWLNQLYIDSAGRCHTNPTKTSASGKKDSLFYTLNTAYLTDGEHVLSFAVFQTTSNAGALFEGCIEYEDGYKDYLYSGCNGETLVSKLGCTYNVYNGASGDIRMSFMNGISDDWHALTYNTNAGTVTSPWVDVKVIGIPSASVISDVAYSFAYADRETVTVKDFGQNEAVDVTAGDAQNISAILGSGESEEGNLIANGDFDADGGSVDTTAWSLGEGAAVMYGTNIWPSADFTSGAYNSPTSLSSPTCVYATSKNSFVFEEHGTYAGNGAMALATDSNDKTNTYLQATTTGSGIYLILKQGLTASASTEYTLRFKVKNFGNAANAELKPILYDRNSSTGENTNHQLTVITANQTADWTEFVYTVTSSSNCASWDFRFQFNEVATVWGIDDIYFYATEETGETPLTYKQNAVSGGTFDTSLSDGAYEFKAASNCTVAWVAGAGTSGGAMTITPTATEAYTSVYIPVVAGKTYTYEFDVLGGSTNDDTRVNAYIIERPGVNQSATTSKNDVGLSYTAPTSNNWQHVYGTWKVSSTGFVEFRIKVHAKNSSVAALTMLTIDNFAFSTTESLSVDGIVLNDSDADGVQDYEMMLSDGNAASYSVALAAGTYEYSYTVANSGLTTAGLKVGGTTYTATSGSFTLDNAVSEVAFTTTGTGTAYFDDLFIKAADSTEDTEISGKDSTLNGYVVWADSNNATVAHIEIEKSYSDDLKAVNFKYTVPSYLVDGNYEVYIKQRDFGVYDADGANTNLIATLNVTAKTYSAGDLTAAEVERDASENKVELLINGTKTSPIMYVTPETMGYYDYSTMRSFAKSGVTLYSYNAGYLAGYDKNSVIWTGLEDGEPVLNYHALDAEIMRTLNLNENAKLMVTLNLDAPSWYTGTNTAINETYEDQLVTYSDGSYAFGSRNNNPQVSFASTSYAELCEKVLALLVKHMTEAGYADRIFAVKLSAGETGEWMNYGTQDNGKLLADYSDAALTAFRSYLGDANATIPTPDERNSAVSGAYIDPATQQKVIAYNKFLGQISADRLTGYAQVVKETLTAAGASWLVGGYNGYVWNEASSSAIGAAHTSSSSVLTSEYIDFISSPTNYSERISGYATGSMTAQDSVALNGKLYMVEQDNRVNRNGYVGNANSDMSRGYVTTVEDSTKQITRDLAFDFVRNNGYWMFDMTGGWYNNDTLLARIRELKTEYDTAISADYNTGSNNEVAVFVSEKYYTYLTADTAAEDGITDSSYTTQSLYNYQRQQLMQMGVSYDTYTIEDLASTRAADMQDYKVNIVLSPIEITSEQLSAINAKLKTEGKTVVWVYMAGAYSGAAGTGYSAANIEALTDFSGLTLNTSAERKLQATVTAALSNASDAVGTGFGYGSAETGPYITIADSQATTLATYANGEVACAYKTVSASGKDYTSIYSAVPNLSSEFLRDVCAYAGVHQYSADASDVVETNNSYVAVHSAYGGTKTLTLPYEDADGNIVSYKSVFDVLGNAGIVGELTQEASNDGTGNYILTYTLEDGDTALFRLETSKTEKVNWNDGMLTNGDLTAWDEGTGLPVGYTKENSGTITKQTDADMGTVVRLAGTSVAIQQAVDIEKGKTYVATFMFKTSSADKVRPLLQIFNASTKAVVYGSTPATYEAVQNTWQTYSVQYTPDFTGSIWLRFRINGGSESTVIDVKNLYFDEYTGGLFSNGDMRMVNMKTNKPTGWLLGADANITSEILDGETASVKMWGTSGSHIYENIAMEANSTYIAKFTADCKNGGTPTFRYHPSTENANAVVKHLTKETSADYKYAIPNVTATSRRIAFVLGSDKATADTSFTVTNASFVKNVGDYNEDGVTDATDMTTMRAYLLGNQTTDDFSDLTADAIINSKDLVRIKKYAAQ